MTIMWRRIPLLDSFFGIMDLKLGVSIISLFALLNKVAGAYGIIAIFTGGTTAQLLFYLYSIATISLFLWGLKRIGQENGPKVLIYAHLFAIDHFINTAFISFFAVLWYFYVPHDGRRVANSDAQREVMESGGTLALGEAETLRKIAAQLWKEERGFAAAVLVAGWFIKIYFIFCLYSFALHLRRNSYHSLPLSRPSTFRNGRRYSVAPGMTTPNGIPSSSRYPHQVSTDTTLAETLWEAAPDRPPKENPNLDPAPISHNGSRRNSTKGVDPADEVGELELESLTKAIGTGMSRSNSRGILQRVDSGGSLSAANAQFRMTQNLSPEGKR